MGQDNPKRQARPFPKSEALIPVRWAKSASFALLPCLLRSRCPDLFAQPPKPGDPSKQRARLQNEAGHRDPAQKRPEVARQDPADLEDRNANLPVRRRYRFY